MGKADAANKFKNLAREMKDEKTSGVKKLGDAAKRGGQRKENSNDAKSSGRKD